MCKVLKDVFFINYKYKKEITEQDLEGKSLQSLIILKDDEHDYFSIKLPILVSLLSIIISTLMAIYSQIRADKINDIGSILIFIIVFFILFIRLKRALNVIEKNNTITENNITVYNNIIMKKLEKQEDSEKKYKDEITNLLEKIENNTRHKTKK